MNSKQRTIAGIALLVTLAAFGVASLRPLESAWGLNHLHYLGKTWIFAFAAVAAVAALTAVVGAEPPSTAAWRQRLEKWFWGDSRWPRIVIAAASMVLFAMFRAETSLVGDGYAWLDNFGRGSAYIHKWTEPGSTYLVRWLQAIQGGYTPETAKLAFQLLSVISGGVFVYNAVRVIGQICSKELTRLLALITLLLSGSILFFFGGVEFYAMSWAVTMVLLNVSLRYTRDHRFWWAVIVTHILALLIHLQTVVLLPGLVYLFTGGLSNPRVRKAGYLGLAGAAAVGIGTLVWLYYARIDVKVLLLPLTGGRPDAPGYAVISLPHLRDLVYLVFLVFPGVIALVAMWLFTRKREWRQTVPSYLSVLSLGCIAFVLFYGAAITMGRDWDIMSLNLLPPVLLMLYHIDKSEIEISGRTVLAYLLTVGIMTTSFVTVNVQTAPAEQRAYDLLNDNNRNAWLIYARYLRDKGDTEGYARVLDETRRRFPDFVIFRQLGDMINGGDLRSAIESSRAIAERNPYEPDYQRFLASMYATFGQLSKAEEHYLNAVRLQPYDAGLRHEMAQLYFQQGKYDRAVPLLKRACQLAPSSEFFMESLALAYVRLGDYRQAEKLVRQMFSIDKNSPGAHLIKLTIAIDTHDKPTAKYHYLEYLKYGTGRPGYERVQQMYKNLLD